MGFNSGFKGLTWALDGLNVQTHAPAALPPGKETWYPSYMRPVGSQGRSGRAREISPPPGFDPLTFLPVGSRYNDYAISTPHTNICEYNIKIHFREICGNLWNGFGYCRKRSSRGSYNCTGSINVAKVLTG